MNESFEVQDARTSWISFPVDTRVKWTYANGGYNSTPVSAFDGNINAILHFNDFERYKRTLISPPINLQGAVKPMLSFAHAQFPFIFGQDELRLLFRAGVSSKWDTILVRTEAVEQWDELFINIDEYGTRYLVEDFYIGFCGTTNSGNGVCIDKVVIEEKGLIPKYIRNFRAENVTQGILPSGIDNIPVMKVYLEVFGNIDTAKLNSVTFTSLCSDNNVFKDNGFRVYATTGSQFRTEENGVSTLITPSISLNSGSVTFSNLSYILKTGQNYLWLAADIKRDRFTHGNTVDFKLLPGSISVNSTLLPATEVDPIGNYSIAESIFLDDFEASSQWTLNPDFEIADPQGFIIGYTRDPGYAYSGSKCLGTDLSQNGAYLMNINSSNAYYAVTPPLNLKYFINARLHMKTWNGFDALDNATIDVTTDNGASWTPLWVNSVHGLQAESKWNDLLFDHEFDSLVRKKENVRIRFAMNYSDNQFALSGWNIDNFSVTGNHLETDMEMTSVISPYNDCIGTHNDTVKIVVKNNAAVPSPSMVPVYFALQGKNNTRVYDTITAPIAPGDSIIFVFSNLANFPAPGEYRNFTVSIDLINDEDTSNNAFYKPVYLQQYIIPPSNEKFEVSEGYWRIGGNSSWECMRPDGSIPVIQQSPRSWMESPYGGYSSNDTSWVVSSCYDLSTNPDLLVELKLWMETEEGHDGMNIQYTYDNGLNWHVIDNSAFAAGWGWYTDIVPSLSNKGWSRNTYGWKVVREFLPASLLNRKKVQFRAFWRSDGSINARGAAFDDFKIFSAPPDIGISQINTWSDNCEHGTQNKVTVTIRNKGVVSMKQNDTIIVGYDIGPLKSDIDTFQLNSDFIPGQTLSYTFKQPVGYINPGNHIISAYTLIEDDPWFYGPNNDSMTLALQILPGPVIGIPDTISTREPDTVVIRPFYNPDYDYLWHDMSVNHIYNVSQRGWQTVLVTDVRGNGCSAKDSTYVQLLYYDAGAGALLFPTNHCGFSVNEFVTMSVNNFGTDFIASGQKILVVFKLNGGSPVYDTLLLNTDLKPGQSVEFTFGKKPIDLRQKGNYSFKLYTAYMGDTIAANDTIVTNINILGRPYINLGPDITEEALSYTLDAGTGYQSYLWDNNAFERTRQVYESGSYWVRVTDGNGCDNSDTIFVHLKIRDLRPIGFNSPVSGCVFNPEAQVSLRIHNSGNVTLPAGTSITASYKFQGGQTVSENKVLNQQLTPGAFLVHTFTQSIDLSSAGDFTIEATALVSGDLKPENDKIDTIIYRYAKPVVNFGLEKPAFIEDVSVLLEAGYNPYYEYDWQDTATTHSYKVTSDGMYHVMTTDIRTQCFDRDTVMIFLIYSDVGVTWTNMPESGCAGEFEDISVRISNLGPSVIGGGAPVYVACVVNGNNALIDTLVRPDYFNLNPGASLDLKLSGSIPVPAGDSRIRFYTLCELDKRSENDTLVTAFNALPLPEIDFGDDNGILKVEFPYMLDAGPGHQSYLWQDNSTGQTFNITEEGNYQVTVTGMNNCQATKSVRVDLLNAIGELDSETGIILYPNPNNGLFHIRIKEQTEDITLGIINSNGQQVFIRTLSPDQIRNESIDVQGLARGVYFLLLYTGDQVFRGKLVIE